MCRNRNAFISTVTRVGMECFYAVQKNFLLALKQKHNMLIKLENLNGATDILGSNPFNLLSAKKIVAYLICSMLF